MDIICCSECLMVQCKYIETRSEAASYLYKHLQNQLSQKYYT